MAVKGDRRKASVAAWTEGDNVRRQLFRLLEVGPVVLSQQLEGELELVVQRQRADRIRDGRLMRNHFLHVSQSAPRCVWRKHLEPWLPLSVPTPLQLHQEDPNVRPETLVGTHGAMPAELPIAQSGANSGGESSPTRSEPGGCIRTRM
jgi:hypothetical protein